MKNFKTLNILFGWGVFLIAAVVYLLTIEPTASFWDCGEFIASAYKLEVGHPPGAPLFMLLGRFFTLFAGSAEHAAMMVNILSALASAFTILFLFWSITHLAGKLIPKNHGEYSLSNIIAVLGSGVIGALVFTFSDTFWFSAVEAEVYATSSLFTAVVFWAILKWENEADQKYSNRWLILIAYLIGLSIGVHLLNLLAIPAIVFVYYFRKYKTTKTGIALATGVSILLLVVIMYMIIPGVISLASRFELFFVNSLGLPFNTGVIVYAALIIGLIVYGLYYTQKKGRYVFNTILLGLTVILIGYSSYGVIVIRSAANPPMDQNNPENVFNLLSYINREQYGERPLFYGQYFNAPVKERKEGKPIYEKRGSEYVVVDHKPEVEYDDRFTGLFPRMYSSKSQHVRDYKSWVDINGKTVTVRNARGKTTRKTVPSVSDNLTFLFKYQIGHMYLRYFMWNFSGRQNDIQGHGNVRDGNWITGIPAIDNVRLGEQENLPDHLRNNPAHNKYYMLPFILGVIGLLYHLRKDKKNFTVVMMLFILTGIAIVFYLNQYPHQPRERDYAYAGSFYAFAIWIGLSVMALYQEAKKKIPGKWTGAMITLVLLFVPGLMAFENWDDHDRSGRYTVRDFASNYLNSCRKNGILFTNGDNDTFPLWYAQEVEGIRTDVRVSNLSYLRAGWYVEQMMRKAYESDPFPMTHKMKQIGKGKRKVLPIANRVKDPVDIDRVVDFVASDDKQTKIQSPFDEGEVINYIPSNNLLIEVDSAKVFANGLLEKSYRNRILENVNWKVKDRYFLKDGLTIMDLIATNDWERPIHFSITVTPKKYFNLEKHFLTEGLAHQFVPIEAKSGNSRGEVNTERMYDVLMNKFKWGNMEDPDVYLNQDNRRMLSNFRNSFGQLATALVRENKPDSAEKVMDYCLSRITDDRISYDFSIVRFIQNYYRIGETEKANKHLQMLFNKLDQEMHYYTSLKEYSAQFTRDIQRNMYILRNLSEITQQYRQKKWNEQLLSTFDTYMKKLESNLKNIR